jgi:hypothetical protein
MKEVVLFGKGDEQETEGEIFHSCGGFGLCRNFNNSWYTGFSA